jgi:hypothetical protein
MNSSLKYVKDWWRGYSDADRLSAMAKMSGDKSPGGLIYVTEREMRALADEQREAIKQWQIRERG